MRTNVPIMCILKLGILGGMLLIKQFEEVIWNPKIRAMEIIWFSQPGFLFSPNPSLFPEIYQNAISGQDVISL